MTDQLGAMLVGLRQRKGYSQLRVAESLCAASGETTVTRHEVSRWERQERIPSAFWLRWLAEVLEVPMAELETAAAATRKDARASPPTRPTSRSEATSDNGHGAAPRPTMRRAAQPANAPPVQSNGGDPLSRVTIEFEHQTTSVRLSATYDDPQRAISAIGVFRAMVVDGETGRVRSGQEQAGSHAAKIGPAMPDMQGGVDQTGKVLSGVQQRSSGLAKTALTAGRPAEVPMGIRYTRGPGAAETGR